MTKVILLSLFAFLVLGLAQEPPKDSIPKFKQPVAVIETGLGKIYIELYPKSSPLTVKNFITRTFAGLFDKTTFHRIVKNFVIQGGDPNSIDDDPSNDGYGGGEMGVEPRKLSNTKGTISMASASRMQPIDSQSDAQFFINLQDNLNLDKMGFIPFGKVIKGTSVVSKIAQVKTDARDRPIKDVVMTKVTIIEKSAIPK